MKDQREGGRYLLEYYKDAGIDGNEAKARYTLRLARFPDARRGPRRHAQRARPRGRCARRREVFVAGGSYDKVPDLASAMKAGLPILEAAKELRK